MDMEQLEISFIAGGECKMAQSLERQFGNFSQKKAELSYDLAIIFLNMCPKVLKTFIHTKTYTKVFRAELLVITKIRKQPRHL